MIKNNLNGISFKQFLEEYVIHPDYWMTFTFSYNGKSYQFDYDVLKHPEKENKMPYCFVVYSSEDQTSCVVLSITWYSSFFEAISKVKMEGKSFEEIYNDPDSEVIDLN